MMFFGFVLGVCWKSLFKRFNIGAVLMFFVMLITMFVAAEVPGCLKGHTLEGSCSVKVKTNASTIKATMEIKGGSGDFNGSITIGSCTIKGTFSLGIQTFAPDNNGGISYRSPITIEATKTEVTFKVGTNPKKTFCPSAPFDVQGGEIIRTTIALKLDSGNMVSLKLADSVEIDNDNRPRDNSLPVWGIVLICVGSSVLFIAIVVIIGVVLCCCCCKKNKKTNQKQDGQKKPIGVGNSKAQEKKQPAVAPEFKIPDQFEWPTDDFTTEQLDLLLECFPVKKISNVELDNRVSAFLKKHPIKTKEQLDNIGRETDIYTEFADAHLTKSGRRKWTRELEIADILYRIEYYGLQVQKCEAEEKNQKMEKEAKKEVQPPEKKEDQLGKEAKKEGGLIEKKEGGLIEKKENQPEKKENQPEKKEAPLEAKKEDQLGKEAKKEGGLIEKKEGGLIEKKENQPEKKENQPEKKENQPEKKENQPEKKENQPEKKEAPKK